jgi:ketosteroid isomerase-like protein
MNSANTITELEQQAGKQQVERMIHHNESIMANTPQQILKTALHALREGDISDVLEQFADDFTFTDHTLSLEFTDKLRLKEFLEKSRELFADTAVEIASIFEQGDHAIAQWKLSAT